MSLENKKMEGWQFQGCWIKDQDIDYGNDDQLYYQDNPNTFLKKELYLDKVNQSHLYVAVLGYYVLYINGKRVADYELNSDWTNYKEVVYYDVYDVSEYLKEGNNVIGFELGNGMYNPSPLKLLGKYNLREQLKEVGTPRLICDLVCQNKTIISSDASWLVSEGNYLFNNLYLGETIDNNRADVLDSLNNDTCWKPVFMDVKKRNFAMSRIPKIKRFKNVKEINSIDSENGVIIDFGEIISGYINIKVNAKKGQVVKLLYSEEIFDNTLKFDTSLVGSVGHQIGEFSINGGTGAPSKAIQTDTIICKDGINTFTNKFTYHTFRYTKIEGLKKEDILDVYATYVYTDLKRIGTVETDNDFYNELYDVGIRTKLNNVHSVFEDCARERLGYGGDIVALATSNLYTFDLEEFNKKVIVDFRLEQTSNGGIPETAPYIGIQTNGTGQGEGPLLWQLVYPYLTYKQYQYYGDKEFVKQEYKYIKRQMQYVLDYGLDTLVNCCLGDHGSILIAGQFKVDTPDKLFVGYCTVLLFLKYNMMLSNIVGDNTPLYTSKYEEIKEIIITKFLNEDATFGDRTQTGFAFALALDLVDSKQLAKEFVDKIIEDSYVFNTGIMGMMLSYEMLNKYGYDDIVEKWLTNDGIVSYKQMISRGNKVLAELFIGEHLSLNHAMFSSYIQWYYQGLAGIKIHEDAIGFDKIMLSPYFSSLINTFDCSLKTKNGNIVSSWKRMNNQIEWKVSIPKNIHATITIPKHYRVIKEKQIDNQSILTLRKENT